MRRALAGLLVGLMGVLVVSQRAHADQRSAAPGKVGLCLWLDASDSASVERDATGHVTTWRDRSGHGNDAVAKSDRGRPRFIQKAINGRPVLRFAGAQWLLVDHVIRKTPGSATVFIVTQRSLNQAAQQPWQRLISSRGDTTRHDNQLPNFCMIADSDGTGKPYAAAIFDAEQTGVTIGPLAIGRSTVGPQEYLHGDIAEVLVYDRAFASEGEIKDLLQYLNHKWGARIVRRDPGWTRTGDLGTTPRHQRQDLPLSDQANTGNWTRVPALCDEFDAASLDKARWHLAWTQPGDWEGRQPAWFDPANVFVKDGMLNLVFRKSEPSDQFKDHGYHTYTSAFVRTNARTGYGYYETRARPMRSAGSSSFWFTGTGRDDNQTEIDVFELGGAAPGFECKYNMTAHVWSTPQEKRHWAVGSVWIAPMKFADDFHVYGFEWNKRELTWYVDGVPVRRMANSNWHFAMYLCFDSEAMWSWFGQVNDADLPSTFQIDYIRVWQKPDGQ